MKNFNWTNPYPTVRIPLFARNVVSTSHPLAAQAGLRMLLKGGNAVDAAIAAAAAITLVEPVSCGLGCDAFAIRLGRRGPARPELVGRGAGRLEPRVLQDASTAWPATASQSPDARLGRGDGARRGGRLGRVAASGSASCRSPT